jgi:hypothetical protein
MVLYFAQQAGAATSPVRCVVDVDSGAVRHVDVKTELCAHVLGTVDVDGVAVQVSGKCSAETSVAANVRGAVEKAAAEMCAPPVLERTCPEAPSEAFCRRHWRRLAFVRTGVRQGDADQMVVLPGCVDGTSVAFGDIVLWAQTPVEPPLPAPVPAPAPAPTSSCHGPKVHSQDEGLNKGLSKGLGKGKCKGLSKGKGKCKGQGHGEGLSQDHNEDQSQGQGAPVVCELAFQGAKLRERLTFTCASQKYRVDCTAFQPTALQRGGALPGTVKYNIEVELLTHGADDKDSEDADDDNHSDIRFPDALRFLLPAAH